MLGTSRLKVSRLVLAGVGAAGRAGPGTCGFLQEALQAATGMGIGVATGEGWQRWQNMVVPWACKLRGAHR